MNISRKMCANMQLRASISPSTSIVSCLDDTTRMPYFGRVGTPKFTYLFSYVSAQEPITAFSSAFSIYSHFSQRCCDRVTCKIR
ncbi:hypothetical protein P8C59_005957 [Phyllachora maydis]|uniref:Uncharacterized protein n=1 Tax=Phyllachora maydis TaxID=1825666 RepID=A0AAD9I5J1_9PEZI|nr:hypothetical protein P8C59_005957 [Phyllachora maydis]